MVQFSTLFYILFEFAQFQASTAHVELFFGLSNDIFNIKEKNLGKKNKLCGKQQPLFRPQQRPHFEAGRVDTFFHKDPQLVVHGVQFDNF